MTANDNSPAGQLDQFRELLRTIDPAALNHDDRAALIELVFVRSRRRDQSDVPLTLDRQRRPAPIVSGRAVCCLWKRSRPRRV